MNNFIIKLLALAGIDGLAHILANALIVLALHDEGIIPAIIIAAIISVGKEVIDMATGDTWRNSVHDLICDAIGIAVTAILI